MITYHQGSPLEALLSRSNEKGKQTYLIHCCDAQGGLQELLEWPTVDSLVEHQHLISECNLLGTSLLGHIVYTENVIGLVAIDDGKLHLGHLVKSLRRAEREIDTYGDTPTVVVPYKLGCTTDTEWQSVLEIIEVMFGGCAVEVYDES
jgi:hypothetical protein